MAEFNTMYNPNSFSDEYSAPMALPQDQDPVNRLEQPIISVGEIGQSVTEGGRFGNLIQTATAAIRKGVGIIELSSGMGGGGEPVGVENYGKDARQALRELAKVNQVQFSSVHTPSQIGNMSGFDARQGFSDENRKNATEELKKAIDFASDLGGAGVVIHTNEFQRPISSQKWAKNSDGSFQFLGYNEEPGRAITYMVDDRTGRIVSDVRKSQIIREPVYKRAGDEWEGQPLSYGYADSTGKTVNKGDYLDQDGNYLDPLNPEDLFRRVPKWNKGKTRFETQPLSWNEIEERRREVNEKRGTEYTAEEIAFRIQMETRMLQHRGHSLYHGQRYDQELDALKKLKQALVRAKELEESMPKEEVWRLLKQDKSWNRYLGSEGAAEFADKEYALPSELLQKEIDQNMKGMKYTHESSSASDAQADEIEDTLRHVLPVEKYAKQQSAKTAAEAGIHAWIQSQHNPHSKKDTFIAMENIFPDQGFGSHPEELKELVFNAREKMVEYLTKPKIVDPHGRINSEGSLQEVENPWYVQGINEKQAEKYAADHIKATLDVQHLGMWRKHFVPKPGEAKQDTDKRFNKWYMGQIEMLADSGVVGHIHLVDAMGGGHHHLPAGQGNLPVVDAVKYLKKKGYGGLIVSEAFGEEGFGQGRQITETWKAFGSPIYSTRFGQHAMGTSQTWPQAQHAYFGANQPPFYIFGNYAPSNDWTLWSQVPLE